MQTRANSKSGIQLQHYRAFLICMHVCLWGQKHGTVLVWHLAPSKEVFRAESYIFAFCRHVWRKKTTTKKPTNQPNKTEQRLIKKKIIENNTHPNQLGLVSSILKRHELIWKHWKRVTWMRRKKAKNVPEIHQTCYEHGKIPCQQLMFEIEKEVAQCNLFLFVILAGNLALWHFRWRARLSRKSRDFQTTLTSKS